MPKRERTIDGKMGMAGPVTKELEAKEEDQITAVDAVIEPAASTELRLQVVEEMRKRLDAMHFICLLHNVYFQKPVNKQESMHGKLLLDSVHLVLSDPLYDILCHHDENDSHYDLCTLASIAVAVVPA